MDDVAVYVLMAAYLAAFFASLLATRLERWRVCLAALLLQSAVGGAAAGRCAVLALRQSPWWWLTVAAFAYAAGMAAWTSLQMRQLLELQRYRKELRSGYGRPAMGDLPTYEFTTEGLTRALRDLGFTANGIAWELSELGCVGGRGCESNCPLARYVHLVMPAARVVYIYLNDDGAAYAVVEFGWGEDAYSIESDDLPEHGEFVRRFDRGLYPDLIEEASDVAA